MVRKRNAAAHTPDPTRYVDETRETMQFICRKFGYIMASAISNQKFIYSFLSTPSTAATLSATSGFPLLGSKWARPKYFLGYFIDLGSFCYSFSFCCKNCLAHFFIRERCAREFASALDAVLIRTHNDLPYLESTGTHPHIHTHSYSHGTSATRNAVK